MERKISNGAIDFERTALPREHVPLDQALPKTNVPAPAQTPSPTPEPRTEFSGTNFNFEPVREAERKAALQVRVIQNVESSRVAQVPQTTAPATMPESELEQLVISAPVGVKPRKGGRPVESAKVEQVASALQGLSVLDRVMNWISSAIKKFIDRSIGKFQKKNIQRRVVLAKEKEEMELRRKLKSTTSRKRMKMRL